MRASNIIAICHLGTIMTTAPAFQLQQPINIASTSVERQTSLVLNAHPPPFNPHNRRRNNYQRPSATRTPLSSTVDAEVLTEADELLNEQFNDDADGWNQRRTMKDFRSTKEFRTAGATDNNNNNNNNSGSFGFKRESEVINFDPEQPIFKPLKSADEHGYRDPFAEQFDDFSKFQREQNAKRNHQHVEHFPPPPPPHHRGHPNNMMPPPPMGMPEFEFTKVHFDMPPPPPHHMMPPLDMPPPPHFFNGHMMNNNGPFMSENNMPPPPPNNNNEDENYVDRVNFADHGRPVNDRDNTGSVDTFFSDRPAKNTAQPGSRRGGPSVYTSEEEELIASMGGMGPPPRPPQQQSRPSTQEFAEAGTQSAMRSPPPQQQQQFRQEGYLGDSTLKEISMDYGVPITYLADVLATWGVPIPIDPNSRLGDMVTGEQAFAVLEAIHTLDVAELHERYAEDDLMNLCEYYDLDIKMAFEFCMERGWALPFGVRTFLRVEQEEELLDALAGDDGGLF